MALNYELRREAHAIGEFTATLTFFGAVGAPTFAKVVSLLNDAAKALDLPAPMNVQVFNIAFGNALVAPAPAGTGFQRFAGNGEIACSLWCEPNSIALTFREYDRWQNVLPKLVDTFSLIAPGYMAEVPAIHSFAVQYLNEFRAKEVTARRTDELFKKDSRWISPFSFESEEPWHCHVGQFFPADGSFRYLMNVNCDISPNAFPDQTIRNYVKVLILAACHYDMAGKGPLVAKVADIRNIIEKNLADAHKLEKRLLGEIISDEYLAIMGEGANEH